MSNDFDSFKDSIDDWATKWDKALKDGVFKDAPKSQTQTAPTSFFGMSDITPKNSFDSADTQYWNTVSSLADRNQDSSEVLREMFKPAENVRKVAQTPNPIPTWTIGKDQDNLDDERSNTNLADDMNELAEMKVKLQALEEKILSSESRGEKVKSVDTKIKELRKKIDDLSDAMGGSSSSAPNGGK